MTNIYKHYLSNWKYTLTQMLASLVIFLLINPQNWVEVIVGIIAVGVYGVSNFTEGYLKK